jgi:uncharacterized membrane protein YbaN (DUF454 family)
MEDSPDTADLPVAPVRWALLLVAVASLGLAVLGIFLPVLPTVPFLLVAAWAAARSSPRLSHWLEHHPRFGTLIRDWRAGGVVRRRTKWNATVAMALSAVLILLTVTKPWAAALAIGTMTCVLAWLWRRPEDRADGSGDA